MGTDKAAGRQELHQLHRRELERDSAIDPAVMAERGYRTLRYQDRHELAALGIVGHSKDSFPGLLLPMFRATGEPVSVQFKPAIPAMLNGRPVKYLSPRARGNHLDVHPRNMAHIRDVTVPLWITEGIKKGDSLTSNGCCVVTLTGVFNWRSKYGTLGDWEDVPLKGRIVFLCFDADARHNMNVARAMVRLGRWCTSKGAVVKYLIVPAAVAGRPTKGIDDYFAAGGTLPVVAALATTTEPETESADGTFSDSQLAETIADEVMADRFVWSKALGWLKWTGQVWKVATEETVGEVVRKYVVKRFAEVAGRGKKSESEGWLSMLGAHRLRTVVDLTKGIVEREPEAFDANADLLNTPAGIVDLPSGQVLAHEPAELLTKITRGSYRPEFTHPDWEQALTALPVEVSGWLQIRVGQAITGHTTPDGVSPVLQGGGENGKSAMTTFGIVPALGDYAAPVSPKLIAGARAEHSTERADLRGQRFLVAEELTEGRALDVTALKQITDVGVIKARYICRDNMSFETSHSLFVTTNYIPVVNETDHGTWRRLALVRFPYTFRKAGEPLTAPADRRGDPKLKFRLKRGTDGRHDAIVTWAVDGARRWYEGGFPPPPAAVETDTRSWRIQADRILAFWDECLVPDETTCVLTTDLFRAFNAWLQTNGHRDWSKETFHPRFRAHDETAHHRVVERRTLKLDGLRRPYGLMLSELPMQPVVYLGVRFRTSDDKAQDPDVDDVVAEVADRSTPPSREASLAKDGSGSATSASGCCEGGSLEARCKLCPASPTYWRPPSEEPGAGVGTSMVGASAALTDALEPSPDLLPHANRAGATREEPDASGCEGHLPLHAGGDAVAEDEEDADGYLV